MHKHFFSNEGASRVLFSFPSVVTTHGTMSRIFIDFTPVWKLGALVYRGNHLLVLQNEC